MRLILFLIVTIYICPVLASESSFELQRQGCRREITNNSETRQQFNKGILSPVLENDRAEDLVDNGRSLIRNLKKMDENKLNSGKALVTPWSDSYWPLYRGGLGQRYSDPAVGSLDWKETIDYISAHSVESLIANNKIDDLSPSEKYDVLFDLKDGPLTTASWNEGSHFFREYGKVESWMGLCHGWAAASMMMPEPKKKVTIQTTSGQMTLFPSDIKGLVSLLWAKGKFPTRIVGGRCNIKNPREDRWGRPAENDCIDNNPGTWHLVVVNQLGVSKRPFIMDASYDLEVWNQPVFSYDYTYFDPRTKKRTTKFSEALVARGEWSDPRAKFRSKDAEFVVGVVMNVTYAVANEPSILENQEVMTSELQYEYDLELNRNYEIVGGEWYSKYHPDFLWTPSPKSFPLTYGDVGEMNLDFTALPREIKSVAFKNANYALPWGPVVRDLVRKSSR